MTTSLLLCQCDSIVTKAVTAAIPVMQQTYEAGTNCKDVAIVKAVCCSLVIIVAICVVGFLLWNLIDNRAKKNEREFTKTNEKEESKRQTEADLLTKKLDILHELCFDDEKLRGAKSDEVRDYLSSLDLALGITTPTPKNHDEQIIS